MFTAKDIQNTYEAEEDRHKREAAEAQLLEITAGTTTQIPPSLRVALERGWIHLLPDMLQNYKVKKEDEIVSLCQKHYRGYLDSVQQLVKMRTDCLDVRSTIISMNETLQKTGHRLVATNKRTKALAMQRRGVAHKCNVVRACRELIAITQRARSQIASKRYVSAVHTLLSLEEAVKKELVVDTPIAQTLMGWLPGAQSSVISANRTALESWLITSRLQARKVGATLRGRLETITSESFQHHRTLVLRQVEVYLGFGVWSEGSVEPSVRKVLKHAAMPEMNDDQERCDDMSSEAAAKVMDELVTSLSILDHASHVHATRSPKHLAEFRVLYCRLRSPHFSPRSLLELHVAQDLKAGSPCKEANTPMKKWVASVLAWPDLLDTLAGFFGMERTLSSIAAVPRALFSRADLDGLWLDACDELATMVDELFKSYALAAENTPDSFWATINNQVVQKNEENDIKEEVKNVSIMSLKRKEQEEASSPIKQKTIQKIQNNKNQNDENMMNEIMNDPSIGFIIIKMSLIGLTNSIGLNTYGFTSEPILSHLRISLNMFIQIQYNGLKKRINCFLETEANQPMVVADNIAFERWIEPFGLDNISEGSKNNAAAFLESYNKKESTQQRRFPMTFGFSAAVPLCCHALHRLLVLVTDFAHGLDDVDSAQLTSHEGNHYQDSGNNNGSNYEDLLLSRKTLLRKCAAKAMMLVNEMLLKEIKQDEASLKENVDAVNDDYDDAIRLNEMDGGGAMSAGRTLLGGLMGMRSSVAATPTNQPSTTVKRPSSASVISVSISQAAQLSLDARAFAGLMPRIGAVLEHALSSFVWFDEDDSRFLNKITIGDACRALESTADKAQDLIFEIVREKCDDLICLDTIAWEPTTAPESSRPEILDLIDYLRVTFMCLTYLPTSIREAVHFASCSHVNSCLRTELMNVKKLNSLALYALGLDILALENFADECGVPQLRACFKSLRQLLDALLDKNASKVLSDDITRSALYPQVDVGDVVLVLVKIVGLPVVTRMKTSGRTDLPCLDKKQAVDLIRMIQA